MKDKITLGHGSGGKLTHELIRDYFHASFGNEFNRHLSDATNLPEISEGVSVTTDSFVVDPIFFPGGDIGKLAVCGTVNDLAVSGAEPLYLTAGFIIEEGFPFADLKKILASMKAEAARAGVFIVAGDTKVVNKGKCDKIFINTTGIGKIKKEHEHIGRGDTIMPGDKILINGTLGDHGMAVMACRENLHVKSPITSDCASLNGLVKNILEECRGIRFMRDPTRGGLASVLCEIAEHKKWGIEIEEDRLPVEKSVQGFCEMLGFDPVYVANEGKVVFILDADVESKVLSILRNHPLGSNAATIGTITSSHPGRVTLNTTIGGKRIIDMLAGEQLPRIC